MSITTNDVEQGLLDVLKEAQAKIQQEHQEFDQSVEQTRSVFEYREQAIESAINGLEVAFGKEIDFGPMPGQKAPLLSISEKNLKAVEDYLVKRGSARQADIVADTKLNSGTVSVALRRLMEDGTVQRGEKERGSQTWAHLSPVPEGERETVIHPGEAPTQGRKKATSAA